MKTKQSVFFGFAVLLVTAMFTMAGCNTGTSSTSTGPSDSGTPPPAATSPTAAYLSEKSWVYTSGPLPDGANSMTLVFSGNQFTETIQGGSRNGKKVVCSYTLTGLTANITITSSDLPAGDVTIGAKYSATFNAVQATTFTISGQNIVFTRSGGGGSAPVFTLTNISNAQKDEGSNWFVFGLFNTGTSKDIVLKAAKAHKSGSQNPGADVIAAGVAYVGGNSADLPLTGSSDNYSLSSPLTSAANQNTWTGSGTYDGWVLVYNGSVWNGYKATITVQGNVTKSAKTDFSKQITNQN